MLQAFTPVPAGRREMVSDHSRPTGSGEESPSTLCYQDDGKHIDQSHGMRPGLLVRRAGSVNIRLAINGRGAPPGLYAQNGTPIDVSLPMQIQG